MCTYYDTLFVTSVTPFYSGEYKWVCKCVWLYFHTLQMYWPKNSKAFAYWVTGFFLPLSSSLSLPITLSSLSSHTNPHDYSSLEDKTCWIFPYLLWTHRHFHGTNLQTCSTRSVGLLCLWCLCFCVRMSYTSCFSVDWSVCSHVRCCVWCLFMVLQTCLCLTNV